MTFALWVVNSSDKAGGKVPRSAKCIVFENSDLTSSFITTNDQSTQWTQRRDSKSQSIEECKEHLVSIYQIYSV